MRDSRRLNFVIAIFSETLDATWKDNLQIYAQAGLPRPPVQQKAEFAEDIGLESITNLEADHLLCLFSRSTDGDTHGSLSYRISNNATG